MRNKKIEIFLSESELMELKEKISKSKLDEEDFFLKCLLQKEPQRKRDKQVKFFVSDKELEQIEKNVKKSKMKKSDFLRDSALEKKIIVIDDFKECFIELKKQGTNINQIAKAVNGGRVMEIGSLAKLEQEYKKLSELMNKIVGLL